MRKIAICFCFLLTINFYMVFCSNDFKIDYMNFWESHIIGERFIKNGDFQKALFYFKWGLKISNYVKNNSLEMYVRSKLALIYWEIGDIKNAEEQYYYMVKMPSNYCFIQQKELIKHIEIIHLYKEGKKFRKLSKLRISIESFRRAIDISESIANKSFKLKCLRHLGITYWAKEDYQTFFNINIEAILIAIELNSSREIGYCLNHIGLFYWKINDYSNALYYFRKALSISKNLNNIKEESIILNNMSLIYKELGDYKSSLSCLIKSLFISNNSKDEQAASMVLNNIGVVLKLRALMNDDKENFKIAYRYFLDSLHLARRNDNIETEIRVLNNIGIIHQNINEHKNAVYYFNKGLEKNTKINNSELTAMLINNLGISHLHLNELDNAFKAFKEAIKLCSEEGNKEVLWEAYYGLGKIYDRYCEYQEAEKCLKKSIDIIDNIRSNIDEDENKIGFARNKQNIYEAYINHMFTNREKYRKEKLNSDIFNIIEKAKARALLETIIRKKTNVNECTRNNTSRIAKEHTNAISESLIRLLNSEFKYNENIVLVKSIKEELQCSNKDVKKNSYAVPKNNNCFRMNPCSIRDVQNSILDDKTALIEYFLGEENSYLIYITKGMCETIKLSSKENIAQSITAYIKLLSSSPKRNFSEFKASKRICNEIFISDKIEIERSISHLIIIPDGVLNYFPFETLIIDSRDNKIKEEYLISKYSISYAPSAAVLIYLKNRKDNNIYRKELLAIGVSNHYSKEKSGNELEKIYKKQGFNYSKLSYCKLEIKTIDKVLNGSKKDILINHKASESLVKKILYNKYCVIHFACHGFYDQEYPQRSALLLSSNNNADDGYLQIGEVGNIELTSDLVVLSACQTGKGKIEKGEGIIGFPRTFLLAGAKSVLSTLWKIEDKSTVKFMKHFYLQLKKGENKSDSLRKAKILMIKSRYSHPFYWAAFVLNGDYSSQIRFQ